MRPSQESQPRALSRRLHTRKCNTSSSLMLVCQHRLRKTCKRMHITQHQPVFPIRRPSHHRMDYPHRPLSFSSRHHSRHLQLKCHQSSLPIPLNCQWYMLCNNQQGSSSRLRKASQHSFTNIPPTHHRSTPALINKPICRHLLRPRTPT